MSLTDLIHFAQANPDRAVVALVTCVLVFWKRLPRTQRDVIEHRIPRVVGTLRLLAYIFPDVVGAGQTLRDGVVRGQPKRAHAPTSTPVDREPPPASLPPPPAVIALCLALSIAVTGCPLPPPDGCTPQATRCSPTGVPQVCSQSQRWAAATPEPCATANAVCCLTQSAYSGGMIHACVHAQDCADGGR